jgi:hypothetical protein
METVLTGHPGEESKPLIGDKTIAKREQDKLKHEVGGGAMGESLGGGGAIVLAILGLIGLSPFRLASIATIAMGAALMLGGGTVAARFSGLIAEATDKETGESVGGGLAFASICGVAGVVLGILALVGIERMPLLGIASIVLGVGLAWAGGATARLNELLRQEPTPKGELAVESIRVSSGAEAAIGLGAIVLGILALAGITPLALILVSMLALGVAVLMSGSSVAFRMMNLFR